MIDAAVATNTTWKKKSDKERLNSILYVSLELIRKISILLYPIIPESSIKALKTFNITEDKIDFNSIKNHEILKVNSDINKIPILLIFNFDFRYSLFVIELKFILFSVISKAFKTFNELSGIIG